MTTEATIVILFSVATAVAITARWLRFPYTVGLVLTGLLLGALHLISPPHLTRDLLFAVFLPGLLYEASIALEPLQLRRVRAPVIMLAVPGVVASIVLTGLGMTAAIRGFGIHADFPLVHGLVFGSLVAATDPIAVVALFRSIRVPERLTTLIDAESLLNDGTSIVLFSLLLGIVSGAVVPLGALMLHFVLVVGGGVTVGLALAWVASRIIARIDDPLIEITITVIVAYGAFVVAEELGVSGVIATVTAGMYGGAQGRTGAMSDASRLAVTTFWSYLAFALNSVAFLLVGFEVDLVNLRAAWPEIVVAYVAMLVARAGVVFGVNAVRRRRHRLPIAWNVALTWGGLRGALSMVLALSLPAAFPSRPLLVAVTFGVVLLSIVVQGLSMPWVVRRLGIADDVRAVR